MKNLKLIKLRKKHCYTSHNMASMLGISKGYYSLIENGKRRLYYDLAVKIAKIFNMMPDDIFYNKTSLKK